MKKLAVLSLTVAGFALSAVGCASHQANETAENFSAPTTSAAVEAQAQTPIGSTSANVDANLGQPATATTNTPATNAP